MPVTAALRPAVAEDRSRIRQLLDDAGLPTQDLGAAAIPDFTDFIVATDAGEVVGTVAIEAHGGHGLLRSLVVDPAWRGRGLGRALVAAAEANAAGRRHASLTLLTQTAADWFRTLGYRDIPREQAASSLQASAEFSHLCPGSSSCLTKSLRI